MISIVNYGVGNIKSLSNALNFLGINHEISSDPKLILRASKIIVPGVGSFNATMQSLRRLGLDEAIIKVAERGVPILGICLGMQLLLSRGYEGGVSDGLDLIKGEVKSLNPESGIRIPHIGFNSTKYSNDCDLYSGMSDMPDFYYVHGFHAVPCNDADISATFTYGANTYVASIQSENIYGVQFHPEKSQGQGLRLLKNFIVR